MIPMIEEGAANKKHNAKVVTLKGKLILASWENNRRDLKEEGNTFGL